MGSRATECSLGVRFDKLEPSTILERWGQHRLQVGIAWDDLVECRLGLPVIDKTVEHSLTNRDVRSIVGSKVGAAKHRQVQVHRTPVPHHGACRPCIDSHRVGYTRSANRTESGEPSQAHLDSSRTAMRRCLQAEAQSRASAERRCPSLLHL